MAKTVNYCQKRSITIKKKNINYDPKWSIMVKTFNYSKKWSITVRNGQLRSKTDNYRRKKTSKLCLKNWSIMVKNGELRSKTVSYGFKKKVN